MWLMGEKNGDRQKEGFEFRDKWSSDHMGFVDHVRELEFLISIFLQWEATTGFEAWEWNNLNLFSDDNLGLMKVK